VQLPIWGLVLTHHPGMTESELLRLRCVSRQNPDKAMTRPYLGREAASFSSILHDELKGRTAAAG
jgi:hypothetical protein